MIEFENESAFDAHLFRGDKSVARTLGWLTYHTLRSKGSQKGFPDRVCVRDRILYVETKGPKTPISPEQITWLDKLARAGAEVYLWRPDDLHEADFVLGLRWNFVPFSSSEHYLAVSSRPPHLVGERPWLPRSMWIPAVGRADQLPDYATHAGVAP